MPVPCPACGAYLVFVGGRARPDQTILCPNGHSVRADGNLGEQA
jgi:hypothetical protein